MTCTLTIVFSTPGFGSGTVTSDFEVPNGSYYQPYIKSRPDLTSSYCPGHPGYELLCPGNQGEISFYAVATCTDVSIISSSNNCPIPETYDCINGACIQSNQYNTPGLYQSLSDCEVVCGTGCGGKCISNSEWSRIEGLSHQLKQRSCS